MLVILRDIPSHVYRWETVSSGHGSFHQFSLFGYKCNREVIIPFLPSVPWQFEKCWNFPQDGCFRLFYQKNCWSNFLHNTPNHQVFNSRKQNDEKNIKFPLPLSTWQFKNWKMMHIYLSQSFITFNKSIFLDHFNFFFLELATIFMKIFFVNNNSFYNFTAILVFILFCLPCLFFFELSLINLDLHGHLFNWYRDCLLIKVRSAKFLHLKIIFIKDKRLFPFLKFLTVQIW